MSRPTARLRASAAALVLALVAHAPAYASSLGVAPTRLDIAQSNGTADLTLDNQSDGLAAYAVRGFRWHERPSGAVDLEPTDELIVYPQRLVLQPHEKRTIRIGFTGVVGVAETAFRIVASELPAPLATSPPPGASLSIRNRVSIPLFVAGTNERAKVEIDDVRLMAGTVRFALVDAGTLHVRTTSVVVRALDDAGRTIVASDLPDWYLLPGEPRVYESATTGFCPRARRVTVEAIFGSTHVVKTVDASGSC